MIDLLVDRRAIAKQPAKACNFSQPHRIVEKALKTIFNMGTFGLGVFCPYIIAPHPQPPKLPSTSKVSPVFHLESQLFPIFDRYYL